MTVSETMVALALKAAPQFWRDTRDCEKHMRAALTAALSDQVVVPKEPGNKQLRPFGYAPGNYMSRCFSCDVPREDLDKLATSCRECAERRYKNFIAEIAAEPASTSGEVK